MPNNEIKYVPPDGGWGWMVVCAYGLNNLIMVPIMQSFGLIYKGTFDDLGMTATESSIILNVNQAFGMLLALINGPLLRTYGYRKMSVISSLLYSLGIIFTSYATSFWQFLFFYGIMASLGFTMSLNSFSLALNTYFREKRSRASGIGMTIAALGPILLPHSISYLMTIYGSKGTMLILGALSLHSVVGAALLQPIKWHGKVVKDASESPLNKLDLDDQTEKDQLNETTKLFLQSFPSSKTEENYQESKETDDFETFTRKRSRTLSNSHDYEAECVSESASLYGIETPIGYRNSSLTDIRDSSADWNWKKEHHEYQIRNRNSPSRGRSNSLTVTDFRYNLKKNKEPSSRGTRHLSISSIKEEEILPFTKNIIEECFEEEIEPLKTIDENEAKINIGYDSSTRENNKKRCFLMKQLKKLALFFDLDLLRDPIYTNIMLGLSIAIFAELNFSVLTPFFLADVNLTKDQIATVMSTLAIVDLILRGVSPFIGEWLQKPPRIMYLISLCLLIMSRTPMIFVSDYNTILIVAGFLGFAKGVRSVYMSIVIPSYVPLHKLPAANAIQYMANGIILVFAGPLLGVIRDITGSYALSIVFINCVTAVTVTMWLTEFAILRLKEKTKRKQVLEESSKFSI